MFTAPCPQAWRTRPTPYMQRTRAPDHNRSHRAPYELTTLARGRRRGEGGLAGRLESVRELVERGSVDQRHCGAGRLVIPPTAGSIGRGASCEVPLRRLEYEASIGSCVVKRLHDREPGRDLVGCVEVEVHRQVGRHHSSHPRPWPTSIHMASRACQFAALPGVRGSVAVLWLCHRRYCGGGG